MCGLIVSSTSNFEVDSIHDGFEKISKRGPDSSSIEVVSDNMFMFKRLAIMGLSDKGMQPFKLNGNILVANAEIYNYKDFAKELSDDYEFKSQSDWEILLPLYEQVGSKMFNLIDAEFVIVLYDSKSDSLVAARDQIGIRPLFYGY